LFAPEAVDLTNIVTAADTDSRNAQRRQADRRRVLPSRGNATADLGWRTGLVYPTVPASLQETYAPNNRCFGCGPANEKGLRIRSRVEGDEVVAEWRPEPHHQAFDGILNGGIAGALLDCHSNWTAAYHLMNKSGADEPPCTVTAEFHVTLKRPTPMDAPLHLRAHVVESTDDRAVVDATLEANGKVTATCRGTFVAVKEGHPAYHRW
jgi:acyl-coenzyme A thioesterase PaaI-like protein